MNIFNVFFPHVSYILGAMVCLVISIFPLYILGGVISVSIFHKVSVHREKQIEPSTLLGLSKDRVMKLFSLIGFLIILMVYTGVFLFFADIWLRAKPAKNWDREIKTADTAIILGFGYERGESGQMIPGKANEFLLDWTLKHTTAQTILVQEGVWAAACYPGPAPDPEPAPGQKCERGGRTFYRIHRDDEKVYVNTLQAAFCALRLMERLGKTKAVLVAHDLQLERVSWDFEKLKKSRENWQKFEFIVPGVPKTPFPGNSHQLHTRGIVIYTFVELFLSRVRDFFSSVPERCIAPVFESSNR